MSQCVHAAQTLKSGKAGCHCWTSVLYSSQKVKNSVSKRTVAVTCQPPQFILAAAWRKLINLFFFQLPVETIAFPFRLWDPENTRIDAAEKGSMECSSEFDVAYVWQGEGTAQHWYLLIQPFAMGAAAESWQQSCESEKCDGTFSWEGECRATVCCAQFQGCL